MHQKSFMAHDFLLGNPATCVQGAYKCGLECSSLWFWRIIRLLRVVLHTQASHSTSISNRNQLADVLNWHTSYMNPIENLWNKEIKAFFTTAWRNKNINNWKPVMKMSFTSVGHRICAQWVQMIGNRRVHSIDKNYFPMSCGVSDWASERMSERMSTASSAEQANEWVVWANEQTSQQTSEWPSTCVSILGRSEP